MSDPRFKDPLYQSGFIDGIADEQKRIIKIIKDTYEAEEFFELGSFVWTTDIIELIKGEQK